MERLVAGLNNGRESPDQRLVGDDGVAHVAHGRDERLRLIRNLGAERGLAPPLRLRLDGADAVLGGLHVGVQEGGLVVRHYRRHLVGDLGVGRCDGGVNRGLDVGAEEMRLLDLVGEGAEGVGGLLDRVLVVHAVPEGERELLLGGGRGGSD